MAAGDAERRKLERNLHDGAQQHLVALAVKIRLAQDAVEDDPADALAMIDEMKGDVQGAIQELRSLAHGIFPPLLVSGGPDRGASGLRRTRATAATTVDGRASAVMHRHGGGGLLLLLEACRTPPSTPGRCVEGQGPSLGGRRQVLGFEVVDDGAGFDPAAASGDGHGFVNMGDRLGAFGGDWSRSVAAGTRHDRRRHAPAAHASAAHRLAATECTNPANAGEVSEPVSGARWGRRLFPQTPDGLRGLSSSLLRYAAAPLAGLPGGRSSRA